MGHPQPFLWPNCDSISADPPDPIRLHGFRDILVPIFRRHEFSRKKGPVPKTGPIHII